MSKDTRYLEKHGSQWRVCVAVPAPLQPFFGKRNLKHPLGTDSLELANELKGEHVSRFKRLIREAREGKQSEKPKGDQLIVEALELRANLEAEQDGIFFGELDHLGRHRPIFIDEIAHRKEEVEEAEGWRRAHEFQAVANGEATPLISLVDGFLAEQQFKQRQKRDYRRAVEKFVAWCSEKRISASIETTDLKVAGRYVTEKFHLKKTPYKTANKDISAISSYWRWLARKGYTTKAANPWPDQLFAKPKAHLTGETEKYKRPFTDDEAEKLLTGNPSVLLSDAMWISCLSGMRVDEIARLTVEGSSGEFLKVTKAKTAAGIRDIPIHPLLKPIINRRSHNKPQQAFLFDELAVPNEQSSSEHSQPIVKKFTVYRRNLGVDERWEGYRQSRIDFHSFRRWWITKCERARIYPNVIAAVAGHGKGREGMTLSVYSAGPDPMTQMRECVLSVNPPNGLVPPEITSAMARVTPAKLKLKPLNRQNSGRPRKLKLQLR